MNANSAVPLKDRKDKPSFLVEVSNIEKQLGALIHSKGLLHPDARCLYQKAGSTYEKLFLSDLKQEELQDVEYSLWKLHYKHIDEFRRRIRRNSANPEDKTFGTAKSDADSRRTSSDDHIDEFKSFLSRATEFYQNLIVKIRRYYGLSEDVFSSKRLGNSDSVESKRTEKCKFLCHRFFVCLGDLARYREQHEKMGADNHNWSVAASHYLEATITWPDSGNPHNQLAVLATYVGDEFLALYHCIRSLAVKEPFPDAWNNLILLLEENRSSRLQSLSSGALFDFSKPSERNNAELHSEEGDDFSDFSTSKNAHNSTAGKNLWPLLVRTMSFFFLKSSLDDFPSVFSSTIRELDAMMAADDEKLKPMLESYQLLDFARKGPFKTLQLVSVLIFIFHNFIVLPETKGTDDKNAEQHVGLKRLAVGAAFVIMACLVERCAKASPLGSCPLLPAILVFVEYLPSVLHVAEACGIDEKSASAMSYFFGAFVNLLNQLNIKRETSLPERTALWEDRELRGFAPVAFAHSSLDFATYGDCADSFEGGMECRVKRIMNTALMIANRPKVSRKWIFYDKQRGEFYKTESNANKDRQDSRGTRFEEQIRDENGKSVAVEEEEVILFKPLSRYNSAPLCPPVNAKEPGSPRHMEDQTAPSDECLRRATSLLIAQNMADSDASDIPNFRFSNHCKQLEPPVNDTISRLFPDGPISARPPSLSAWVVNSDTEKGRHDIGKRLLSPIKEITSLSFSNLSVSYSDGTVTSSSNSTHGSTNSHCYSATPYSSSVPSAPLLPDDAAWFHGTNKADNFNGASPKSGPQDHGLLDYDLPIPDIMNGYPNLPFRGISSSEWLRRYREKQNLEAANHNYAYPTHHRFVPSNLRNFLDHDSSRFGLLDRYGTPADTTLYMEDSGLYPGLPPSNIGDGHNKPQNFLPGYQRTSPFRYGAMPDLRDDPRPLLQYLKEKEWLIQQRDQTMRGPTYMGN